MKETLRRYLEMEFCCCDNHIAAYFFLDVNKPRVYTYTSTHTHTHCLTFCKCHSKVTIPFLKYFCNILISWWLKDDHKKKLLLAAYVSVSAVQNGWEDLTCLWSQGPWDYIPACTPHAFAATEVEHVNSQSKSETDQGFVTSFKKVIMCHVAACQHHMYRNCNEASQLRAARASDGPLWQAVGTATVAMVHALMSSLQSKDTS